MKWIYVCHAFNSCVIPIMRAFTDKWERKRKWLLLSDVYSLDFLYLIEIRGEVSKMGTEMDAKGYCLTFFMLLIMTVICFSSHFVSSSQRKNFLLLFKLNFLVCVLDPIFSCLSTCYPLSASCFQDLFIFCF